MSTDAPAQIVIAAGGTAGHVVPALAVAEQLRQAGAQVTFIGGSRAEAELVPAAGFPLWRLDVQGMSRSSAIEAARALWLAARALPRARAMLAELSADAVMGAGGYVSAPVGLAALSRRIPLVLTEADSHLGLANRMLARGARRVCLSFPIVSCSGPRYRVTGRPLIGAEVERAAARRRLGIDQQATCVLVFGGSLGASSINGAAIEAFAGGTPFQVLHVTGARDYPALSGRPLPAGYTLLEYLDAERFAEALAACDLVVARAGGSVLEIAAHGRPAILVPYPHASGDHQSVNARWLSQAGAAVVIADGELTAARLSQEVGALLGDRERLERMAGASLGLARPDAARQIAAEVLAAAGRSSSASAAPRGERP